MAAIRVYALAEELGLEPRALLVWLSAQGLVFRSAATPVPEDVAARARARFAGSGVPMTAPPPSPAGEDLLTRLLRGEPPPRSAARTRGSRKSDPVANHSAAVRRLAKRITGEERGPQFERVALHLERDWICQALFSEAEIVEWLDAGLGYDNAAAAKQLVALGIAPYQLKEPLDGRMLGARIRGGEAVSSVIARWRGAHG